MLVGTLDVGPARYPIDIEDEPRENRFDSSTGAPRVTSRGDPVKIMRFNLVRMSSATVANLRGFLEYSVRYAQVTFSVTDDFGNVYNCRWWDRRLKVRCTAGRLYEAELVVRLV